MYTPCAGRHADHRDKTRIYTGDPDTSDGFDPDSIKKTITEEAKKNPNNPFRGLSVAIAKLIHIPNRKKNMVNMDELLKSDNPGEDQINDLLENSELTKTYLNSRKKKKT